MNYSCAAARLFRDESILGEDVDRFADGALCDTELLRPLSFDDPCARPERSRYDLSSESFGKGVLHKFVGGEDRWGWHTSMVMVMVLRYEKPES